MLFIDVVAAWRGDDTDRSLYRSHPSSFERLYRLGYCHEIGDFREQDRTYGSVAEATHNADRLNKQRHERGGAGMNPEIDRALLQALASREDRKRGEQALESLRRKENDAIERLQELVRAPHADARINPST